MKNIRVFTATNRDFISLDFYDDFLTGLMALSHNHFPSEATSALASFVYSFKVTPITRAQLRAHQLLQQQINDTNLRLKKLEQSEGIHSIDLNKTKLDCASELVTLQMRAQQLTTDTKVASCGTRACVFMDKSAFVTLTDTITALKQKHPQLPWQPTENFITRLHTEFSKVAAEDEEFYKSSLLECVADVFESMELYLSKIQQQLLLLGKRLQKLNELRQMEANMNQLDLKNITALMDKEVDAAYQKDLADVIELGKEVDLAEVSAEKLMDTLHQDGFTTSLTQEQLQESGRLFQLIIQVRRMQQDIEDSVPELHAAKVKELESGAPGGEEEK
jgi:hypothetical protein